MSSALILYVFLGTLSVILAEDIFVTIPNGRIKGKKETSARNVTFYAFQQIPYAKPPVGKLRFKAPEPVENWEGTFDATLNDKICYQLGAASPLESEDCLYVNVYTPVHPGTKRALAVMYYIFGGGFVQGNCSFTYLGPHYFMEHNVVVVTVSYRIGPLGFLSTGDTVMPGNYGLKDQSLGLKWVQNNIKFFGGDPAKVTIFGQSSGGASVTLHMMSKQSKGLFRGAIAQSGSALCPWSYQRHFKETTYQLASFIDTNFNKSATSEELFNFLQSASANDIYAAARKFRLNFLNEQLIQGTLTTPVIEPEHETAFITEKMYSIVQNDKTNRVPLMIGICSEEAISSASNIDSFKAAMQKYDNNVTALVSENMHLTDNAKKVLAGEAIRKIYTGGLFQDHLGEAVRYFTDMATTRSVIHFARLQSQFSDVYFYQFSYHGKLGGNNVYVTGAERVGHAEDMKYLWTFRNNSNLDAYPASDILTSKRYITLFTNFAKTLNPTPCPASLFQHIKWPKATIKKLEYLDINEDLLIKSNPKNESYTKWIEIYENMAIKPYDTF